MSSLKQYSWEMATERIARQTRQTNAMLTDLRFGLKQAAYDVKRGSVAPGTLSRLRDLDEKIDGQIKRVWSPSAAWSIPPSWIFLVLRMWQVLLFDFFYAVGTAVRRGDVRFIKEYYVAANDLRLQVGFMAYHLGQLPGEFAAAYGRGS